MASLVMILAGGASYHYAFVDDGHWALLGYAVALSFAAFALRFESIETSSVTGMSDKTVEIEDLPLSTAIRNTAGLRHSKRKSMKLERKQPSTTRAIGKSTKEQGPVIQHMLDFDGLGELQQMGRITGSWLVSSASKVAASKLRQACLDLIEGGVAETSRIERWFEIADCLRSHTCRSLVKAEARRAYVAEQCGVSEEQVRQIDQGRYAPLNNLLDMLDPCEL